MLLCKGKSLATTPASRLLSNSASIGGNATKNIRIARPYSKETLNVLRRLFKERDVEQDGNLNADELEQCLQLVGFFPTNEDIVFLIKHFDTNGDGVLQIEELLENIHVIQAHSIHKHEMMDAFERFDTNKDGYIRSYSYILFDVWRMPIEFTKNNPTPKKPGTTKSSDHGTISLFFDDCAERVEEKAE
ncbi:hypothetical protein LSAT2_020572 [Lamellibrachia satsuma]|nr:hypothetical protein LSAT2_020572 [Lamellibrachia satsuma]